MQMNSYVHIGKPPVNLLITHKYFYPFNFIIKDPFFPYFNRFLHFINCVPFNVFVIVLPFSLPLYNIGYALIFIRIA